MNPKSPSFAVQLLSPPCDWLWIDTACIDKRDLSELSESLNSMYKWYENAEICYAYLSDVSFKAGSADGLMQFMQSKWFARGWTLQELLAPSTVVFTTSDWQVIGHKCRQGVTCTCSGKGPNLTYLISCITKIQVAAVSNFCALRASIPVMRKLAWMANRTTTKPEDRAYCLLGLFNVHLVPCYNEGEHNAWLRLAHEIKNGPASRTSSGETNWWIAQYTGTNAAGQVAVQRQAYYSSAGNVQSAVPPFSVDAKAACRAFQSTAGKIEQNEKQYPNVGLFGTNTAPGGCDPRQSTIGLVNEGPLPEPLRGAGHSKKRPYVMNSSGLYDCVAVGCFWTGEYGFRDLKPLFEHMRIVHQMS